MATITIPDNLYHRLKEVASSKHLPVEELLNEMAAQNLVSEAAEQAVANPGSPEWMNAFNAWIARHAASPFIADDTRDAIYGDEHE